jgi:prepilin-type N-terminal cleavage/methylation domain-containing protein
MDRMSKLRRSRRLKTAQACAGFSLIEVIIAVVILSVGLMALLAVFAQAVSATKFSREDLVAKQKAREALENVYSARNDTSITFADIQNVSSGGIFTDGFQPLYLAGANGIAGTAQDTTNLDSMRLPGPDGRLGTGDDVTVPLVNFQRQIVITTLTNADGTVNADLRSIAVTVRIASPGRPTRDFVVTGYISRYP